MRNWSIAIALSAAFGAEAAPPRSVEIAYEVARNGAAVAEVSERFEHDGPTYRVRQTWKGRGLTALAGSAERSSRGLVLAGGLRPIEFEDRRSGRSPARARFDWGAGSLTLERKGASETRPLSGAAHDRLSFLYGFAFAPPGAQAATFHVADGKGVATYVVESAGRERLRTPAGEFDALKLVKRKPGAEGRSSEIWLAADRHFLPVRILVTEPDGTRIDQVATRLAPAP